MAGDTETSLLVYSLSFQGLALSGLTLPSFFTLLGFSCLLLEPSLGNTASELDSIPAFAGRTVLPAGGMSRPVNLLDPILPVSPRAQQSG